MNVSELWTCRLGTIAWDEALAIQEKVRDARQKDEIADTLLLVEHPPTVTVGRRSEASDIPGGSDRLAAAGIAFHEADRGGRVTCHEEGQLVGYPVMRIDDVHEFVRAMERAMIQALEESGVTASTREGLTGVWCEDRKIGSIGIHVQRGVTTHGFSINCDNDLSTFSHVVACEASTACMRKRVGSAFAKQFGLRQRLVSPARLDVQGAIAPGEPCKVALTA